MIWTVIGLIGMYFGWSNLKSSRADIEAIDEMNGNALKQHRVMRILAYGHYRNDLFRFSKHIVIAGVGILAMITPASPGTTASPTLTSLIVTGGFFTIAILIVIASALDKRQREGLNTTNIVEEE